MKNMLLGLVNVMAFNVNNRLGSIVETVWDNLMARQSQDNAAPGADGTMAGPADGPGTVELVPAAAAEGAGPDMALAPAGSAVLPTVQSTAGSVTKATAPRVYVKRSCTESMVQVSMAAACGPHCWPCCCRGSSVGNQHGCCLPLLGGGSCGE